MPPLHATISIHIFIIQTGTVGLNWQLLYRYTNFQQLSRIGFLRTEFKVDL